MAKKRRRRTSADHAASLADVRRQAMNMLLQREWSTAERMYLSVLRDDGQDFDSHHMLGVIALQTARPERAITLLTRAVRLNPRSAQAHANLGSAQLCLNRADQAMESYDHALTLDPRFALAARNIASGLQRLGRHDAAANAFDRLCRMTPDGDYVHGDLFYSRRCAYDWRDFSAQTETVKTALAAGMLADRPFSYLSVTDSGADQLRCARLQAAQYPAESDPHAWQPGAIQPNPRTKVAYVSADFRGHAVMNLMLGIFECHDRSRFETIGISLAPGDASFLGRRARECFDEFVDVSAMSDIDAAALLRSRNVDIAVDLTGYTQGCRPGIFARRAAPVQVNFLGYPGTLGATFMDYLIADDFVVPASSSSMYAENIVRMPGSFQPTLTWPKGDASPAVTRSEAGLPEESIVLCSFNNGYKLNPAVFGIWMRILAASQDTVLWLLVDGPAAVQRLLREAANLGVSKDRIIVAPRLPYREHIARLSLADLFVDTFPFNAGATASDAILAGVPILTCSGDAFASRMAGSVLRALNLHDLVTLALDQYERLA